MTHTRETINDLLIYLQDNPFDGIYHPSLKECRYFRGQSNFDWELSPGLYREGLFEQECILINESLHMFPEEFGGLDLFSVLIKLQHYGLKTRLMDVTENPLVALYFACKGHSEKDGAIYFFDKAISEYSDSQYVGLIMEYAFYHSGFKLLLDEAVDIMSNSIKRYRGRKIDIGNESDLIRYLTIPGFFVVPKMNNKRLVAQQGAFLCFGMEHVNTEVSTNAGNYGKRYAQFKPIQVENDNLKFARKTVKFRIPKEAKGRIIDDLKNLNIHSGTLFLDLDKQLQIIVDDVKKHRLK